MPRRRKKKKLNLSPMIWFIFWVNLGVGLFFSPVTAAARIRVEGAKESDRARIDKELQWLHNKPPLRVNHRAVEEWLIFRPDVRSAVLSQNLFGSAGVKMSYYEPVAHVAGTKNCVLTEGGFICSVPEAVDTLPTINLSPEQLVPFAAVSSNWEPEKVAEICRRANQSGLINNLSFTVTVSGTVWLNSGLTGRVVLGAPDDIDEKFDKLAEVLKTQPNLLAQGRELVLTAPSKPVTRALQGTSQ